MALVTNRLVTLFSVRLVKLSLGLLDQQASFWSPSFEMQLEMNDQALFFVHTCEDMSVNAFLQVAHGLVAPTHQQASHTVLSQTSQ